MLEQSKSARDEASAPKRKLAETIALRYLASELKDNPGGEGIQHR